MSSQQRLLRERPDDDRTVDEESPGLDCVLLSFERGYRISRFRLTFTFCVIPFGSLFFVYRFTEKFDTNQ